MNETNLKIIKKLWSAFAAYYQMQLTDDQVRMYAEDCQHYSAEAVGRGMLAWRQNPKHNRMPLPGQLLASMGGGASKADAGAIALSLIGAVKRHDYTWSLQLDKRGWKTGSFEGDFKAELGDVAWEVVRLAGGWSMFCGSFWDCGNETAFLAQIRDAIEHVLTTKRGQVTALPSRATQIPASDTNTSHNVCVTSDAQKRLDDLAGQVGGPKEGA